MTRTLRRTWRRLLGSIFHRSADDDLSDELDSHIQLLTEENLRRGLPPEEAHRRARLQFGSVEATKERYRDQRGLPALDTLNADAHYSVRRLCAHPGYALLAVATLALGVGGTASVYGVARGVLFDPLPYAHEREVGVFWKKTDWTHEEFLYIRGRVPGFQHVALYRQRDVIMRDGDEPARLVNRVSASAELFDVLGARVVGHGALLVAAGIGVGVVGAVVLTRLLSSFLYGVSAIDPVAFAAAGLALMVVGMLAAFLPAWRAGRTDPVIALREQ